MNSKYFSEAEQVCKCCGEGAEKISYTLLNHLDRLREMYGHPIYVSCMYRCEQHNRECGGVSNSQHVMGTAADIYVDGDYEDFYQLVLDSELFDGIGKYKDAEFVHVDVRNGGETPNYYLW